MLWLTSIVGISAFKNVVLLLLLYTDTTQFQTWTQKKFKHGHKKNFKHGHNTVSNTDKTQSQTQTVSNMHTTVSLFVLACLSVERMAILLAMERDGDLSGTNRTARREALRSPCLQGMSQTERICHMTTNTAAYSCILSPYTSIARSQLLLRELRYKCVRHVCVIQKNSK